VASPVSEQRGTSIQLHGSFNPRILQPAWLAAQGLIRDAESENAEIRIVHEQVVSFRLEWADLEVDHDRLTVSSTPKSGTPEQVRDLALGAIEILDHTPVYGVGLQFFGHYALEDQAVRDQLGWTLVPPQPFEGQLAQAGMRSLQMAGHRLGHEDDGGGVLVTIEPSAHIAPNGVYLAVLDQYVVADSAEANIGSSLAVECIKTNWESSFKRAEAITTEIFSVA
jgi:hypothetical protein